MIKRSIPNIITSANTLCGCIALVFVFQDRLHIGGFFVLVAVMLDFLDGFSARALKVTSPMGKQLDSLADMVTFGVVPGAIAYKLTEIAIQSKYVYPFPEWTSYLPYVGFVLTIFSGLRLAKFNVDNRQGDRFYGVPTPTNAMFWISIPISVNYQMNELPEVVKNILLEPVWICALAVGFALLLVAPIPLIALKFSNYSLRDNISRYILIVSGAVLLITFGFMSVPIIILLYLILSIIDNQIQRKNEVQS